MNAKIHFGTSSWSEKSWMGVFYPPDTKQSDMLTFYSKHFNTVEADVTYYRIPNKRMVATWREKTPDHFILAAKFPRSIVHGGEDKTPNAETVLAGDSVTRDTHDFLEAMYGLGSKCGPLALQFPYFNKTVFPEPRVFLDRLDRYLELLPENFRYAVELRNRYWISNELIDVLKRHKTCLVLAELPYMPHPADIDPKYDLITADFAYIRLIGNRNAVEDRTTEFNKIVIDQIVKLQKWANYIQNSMEKVHDIFAYANNHFAGYGVETIRMLQSLCIGPAS